MKRHTKKRFYNKMSKKLQRMNSPQRQALGSTIKASERALKALISHPADRDRDREGTPKPFHQITLAKVQDPDTMFPCTISGAAHSKRLAVPRKAMESGRVWGRICVLKQSGRRVVVESHYIGPKAKRGQRLKDLVESQKWKTAKILESYPNTFANTPGLFNTLGVSPNSEFIPVMGGPFSKQLYMADYLDMHAKCFEAKNHNPLAKHAIDVITNFSFGKGVKVKFRNDQAQQVWDAFEKRNKFQAIMRQVSDCSTWAGEIMAHKQKVGGKCALKLIDPSTVWEIVTNPADIDEVYYYHQQFPTQYQLTYKPGDLASEFIINDIPAAEIIHKKLNVSPGEKRGRSDLFSVLGWLKLFKDYYTAAAIKEQVQASMVMLKTVDGSQTDVTALANDPSTNTVPPPGSTIIENKSVTTSFLTGAGGGAGRANDNVGESLRSIIATGMGLSPEYLGVSGGVGGGSKSNSLTKSEPATKKFEDRQLFMKDFVSDVADWLLASEGQRIPMEQPRQANMAALKKSLAKLDFKGMLVELKSMITGAVINEPVDLGYEIIFPDISSEDRTSKIKDTYTALLMKTFSHETASTMVASELGVSNYDYQDEQEKIRQELLDKSLAMTLNQSPQGFTPDGGPAGGSGNGAPVKPGSSADKAAYKAQSGSLRS